MSYQIVMFDRQGTPLNYVIADAKREWVLGKRDHCTLTVPITDPIIERDNFAIGNRFVVWSEYARPWAGTVFVNKEWGSRHFKCEAYGPEIYLDHRVVIYPPPDGLDGDAMIRWLLNQANQQGQTPIVAIGRLSLSTSALENGTVTTGMYIMDALKTVLDNTYSDYYFEPILDGDRILWELNVLPRVTFENNPALVDGVNGSVDPDASVVISGELWTKLFIKAQVKSGDTYEVILPSTLSPVEEFGIWWGSISVKVISEKQAIALARSILRDQAIPRTALRMKVYPHKDRDLAISLRPGSLHKTSIVGAGFLGRGIASRGQLGVDTTLRVEGVRYSEADGYMEVVANDTATDALFDAWLDEILSYYYSL